MILNAALRHALNTNPKFTLKYWEIASLPPLPRAQSYFEGILMYSDRVHVVVVWFV